MSQCLMSANLFGGSILNHVQLWEGKVKKWHWHSLDMLKVIENKHLFSSSAVLWRSVRGLSLNKNHTFFLTNTLFIVDHNILLSI